MVVFWIVMAKISINGSYLFNSLSFEKDRDYGDLKKEVIQSQILAVYWQMNWLHLFEIKYALSFR